VPASAVAAAACEATDWFEAERLSLVGAVAHARRLGRGDLAAQVALWISGFLKSRNYHDDHERTLREAWAMVQNDQLRLGLAQALFSAYMTTDRDEEMPALLGEARMLAHRLDQRDQEVRTFLQSGLYAKRRGRLDEGDSSSGNWLLGGSGGTRPRCCSGTLWRCSNASATPAAPLRPCVPSQTWPSRRNAPQMQSSRSAVPWPPGSASASRWRQPALTIGSAWR